MSESKLRQAQALLAKAERTTFGPERDALNAKAQELIAKYGLEDAVHEAEAGKPGEIIERVLLMEPPYALDKGLLLNAVFLALRCKVVFAPKNRRGQVPVEVFGYPADVDRAELLYTSLLMQSMQEMSKAQLSEGSAARTSANRRVWLEGYSHRVGQRIREAENHVAAGVGTNIVLYDRGALVRQHVIVKYPNLGTVKRQTSGRGYAAGFAAGNRADIGNTRIGENRKAVR